MTIEFDVIDSSSARADTFSVALRRPDGSLIPLIYNWDFYGDYVSTMDTMYFKRSGAGVFRVAVSPMIQGDPSDVYNATAIVTGIWSATEMRSTNVPIRYVVRNDSASVYGKGVTLEGQQILQNTGSGKLIFDASDLTPEN